MTIRGDGHAVLTYDAISKWSLAKFILGVPMFGMVSWKYAGEVTSPLDGLKKGGEISIPRARRSGSTEGRELTSADFQDMVERTIQLKIDQRRNFLFEFTDEDLTFNIVQFGKKFLKSSIEHASFQADKFMTRKLNDVGHGIGTPGTTITTQLMSSTAARAAFLGHPEENRMALLSPIAIGQLGDTIYTDTQVDEFAARIIRKKYRGMNSTYNIVESTNIPTMNVADFTSSTTPAVNSANGFEGELGSMLPTDGWGVNDTLVMNAGQKFTIAGVYTVSPNDTEAIGTDDASLQVFTAMEDVTTNDSGQADIKLNFDLNAGGLQALDGNGVALSMAAYQNVSAPAADNAAITVIGTKGKRYDQGCFFVPDVIEAAAVNLASIGSDTPEGSYVDTTGTGLNFQMSSQFDILTKTMIRRGDTMYGSVTANPEGGIMAVLGER